MKVICPYCNKEALFIDSKIIYNKSFGMIYLCKNCNAYVGVHKGTKIPLGNLANKELRDWRIKAHNEFDFLWKSKKMSRSKAYKFLADKMNLKPKDCHIGMFNIEQCKELIKFVDKIADEVWEKMKNE